MVTKNTDISFVFLVYTFYFAFYTFITFYLLWYLIKSDVEVGLERAMGVVDWRTLFYWFYGTHSFDNLSSFNKLFEFDQFDLRINHDSQFIYFYIIFTF